MNPYKAIISVITFLVILAGAFITFDQRYAHSGDVKQIELRLDQKILNDRSQALQERIWKEQDRNANQNSPENNDSIRRLQAEKQYTDEQIKIINEKVIQSTK